MHLLATDSSIGRTVRQTYAFQKIDFNASLQVTSCSICPGSDGHLYAGEIPALRKHSTLGHEGMGVIESKGDKVSKLQVATKSPSRLCMPGS